MSLIGLETIPREIIEIILAIKRDFHVTKIFLSAFLSLAFDEYFCNSIRVIT